MKALVTGGCGFIGSHLVELLIKAGWDVLVVDNLYTKKNNIEELIKLGKVKFLDISINHPGMKDVFASFRPDYVFHLAAIPEVQYSIEHPIETFNTNVLGTVKILELSNYYNVKKVVFSSSAAVYGDCRLPYGGLEEKCVLNPISPYGLQKKQSEEIIQLFYKIYGLPYAILRYQNVYGPRQKEHGSYTPVMSIFERQLAGKQRITVFGDGKQTRDFVYVKDVALANLMATISPLIGITNIGSGKKKKIIDIAKLYSNRPKLVPNPRTGDIKHSYANIKMAWKLWGWKPTTSFNDGFGMMQLGH
jgi:UDP-glucose 4-epimerase